MRPVVLSILALSILGACDEREDPVDGTSPYCDYTDSPMGPEDVFLGMSGASALDAVPEADSATMMWVDETEAGLDLTFAVDPDTLRSRTGEAVYPGEGEVPAVGVECNDQIAVDATLDLVTDDGRLDESLDVTVYLTDGDPTQIAVNREIDPATLGGSLDVGSLVDTSRFDTVRLFLDLDIRDRDGEVEGALNAQGEGSDGDVSFAENLELGTFDADAE